MVQVWLGRLPTFAFLDCVYVSQDAGEPAEGSSEGHGFPPFAGVRGFSITTLIPNRFTFRNQVLRRR